MRTRKVKDVSVSIPDTPTADTGKAKSYTVIGGDTVQSIAVKLGVDWKDLAERNGISSPYLLTVGQKIKL